MKNNKTYIFLTSKVDGIGGAQLYIENKSSYLKQNGWNVLTLYSNEQEYNKVRYSHNKIYCKDFHYHPKSFYRYKQKEILRDIVNAVIKYEHRIYDNYVIIESHFVNHSYWGELLSKKLHCKHLIFLLSEKLNNRIDELDFYRHKLFNSELFAIHQRPLVSIFNNTPIDCDLKNKVWIAAGTLDNICYEDNPKIDNIADNKFNICCISRLNKIYVMDIVKAVVEFSITNKSIPINLILVGDGDRKLKQNIINIVTGINNLKLTMLGELFPIPKNLFDKVDMFISGAGSADLSLRQGCITLSVDVNSCKPIGLLGIETDQVSFSEIKSKFGSIQEYIQYVYKNSINLKNMISFKKLNYKDIFNKQLNIVMNPSNTIKHYNLSIKPKLKYVLFRLYLQYL